MLLDAPHMQTQKEFFGRRQACTKGSAQQYQAVQWVNVSGGWARLKQTSYAVAPGLILHIRYAGR